MLLFKKKFLPAIRAGEKTQTIRLWKHRRMRSGQRSYIPGAGYIDVLAVEGIALDDLTDDDARPDGFTSAAELRTELARISQCAVKGVGILVGESPARQGVAPAGSSRSGSGGDEAVEAFDVQGSPGDSANPQAVTRVNAEQASKRVMREPTCLSNREGRRRDRQELLARRGGKRERKVSTVPPG